MTKIMTCILSIEKGNPYKTISVSANAADVESTALNGGEWITLDNLRNQMMMISDNGAATAIAENLAGSLPAFAEDMNAKAKEIGMDHTHFVNANGMPDEIIIPPPKTWPVSPGMPWKQDIPPHRFHEI